MGRAYPTLDGLTVGDASGLARCSMGKRMAPYVVQQGDYLAKLAHRDGFDADEVWSDPKNQELAAQRPDHNMLAPGDVIYLPVPDREAVPLQKGTVNRYSATVPKVEVRLALHRLDGTPLADQDYETEGLAGATGKTDGEGKVTLQVPITAREVVIVIKSEELRIMVDVGGLDPAGEASGIKHRLQNLGLYLPGSRTGAAEDEALANAVRVFQSRRGIEPTGELDDQTRQALLDEHRC